MWFPGCCVSTVPTLPHAILDSLHPTCYHAVHNKRRKHARQQAGPGRGGRLPQALVMLPAVLRLHVLPLSTAPQPAPKQQRWTAMPEHCLFVPPLCNTSASPCQRSCPARSALPARTAGGRAAPAATSCTRTIFSCLCHSKTPRRGACQRSCFMHAIYSICGERLGHDPPLHFCPPPARLQCFPKAGMQRRQAGSLTWGSSSALLPRRSSSLLAGGPRHSKRPAIPIIPPCPSRMLRRSTRQAACPSSVLVGATAQASVPAT